MELISGLKYRKFIKLLLLIGVSIPSCTATALENTTSVPDDPHLQLQQRPGFFRFSFDNVKMPNNIQDMGLLGINYFADLTPELYGGVGGYGSISGSQGGLFVLGLGGGIHEQFAQHWWADAGFFAGGGGGRSSLVGGGLMLRPHAGIAYSWKWARLGLHYSYITFPSGLIHSHQVGLDLDLPFDFYYVSYGDVGDSLFKINQIILSNGRYLNFQRNDIALILQAYKQRPGTKNVNGEIQDGTIGVVGAELDHYVTENGFWYVKAGGAFTGIPNGYMDVLGGLGYHWTLNCHFALVPQLGVGAGGGGNVDTGGGILIEPQLGVEWPLTKSFAARISGGYLKAPKGKFAAVTATGALIYHLDIATAGDTQSINNLFESYQIQGWRIQLFNQTYLHPQRSHTDVTSAINLVGVQVDQLFTPIFFLSYQGAFAYSGYHAGGYATGMIGPGIQTPEFFNHHTQLFTELLIGAGGGGGLALGGGSLIEPLVGIHYAFTPTIGLQASAGQLKALRNDLNTPVFNFGLTIRLGTLNQA